MCTLKVSHKTPTATSPAFLTTLMPTVRKQNVVTVKLGMAIAVWARCATSMQVQATKHLDLVQQPCSSFAMKLSRSVCTTMQNGV